MAHNEDYLESAAFHLRCAARAPGDKEAAREMQIADRFAALAAIERGLLPEQVATALAQCLGAATGEGVPR